MKLQLGKRYRTRDGRETSPLEGINYFLFPFMAEVDGSIHFWAEQGGWNEPLKNPLDLVEEIVESEAKQEPRIDYDKMQKEFEETHNSFTYAWNENKYTKTEQEDGTIILKPKKRNVKKKNEEFQEQLNPEISEVLYFNQDKLTTDLAPTITFQKGTLLGNQLTVFSLNPEDYNIRKQENGTIVLTPNKRKVWIEVYEIDGKIEGVLHRTKASLKESIQYLQENGETLLEVIEREYPINKENC